MHTGGADLFDPFPQQRCAGILIGDDGALPVEHDRLEGLVENVLGSAFATVRAREHVRNRRPVVRPDRSGPPHSVSWRTGP